MNRFFTSNINDNLATLSEDDAYHLKNVLRAKIGEKFEICNGIDKEFIATLIQLDKKTAVLQIEDEITVNREPSHRYILCQCIPKGRKLDDVVRHATELGMSEFYPVISERVNIKNIDDYDKTERMQSIVDEAAKQSKRLRIPLINKPIDFDNIIKLPNEDDLCILAWEEETILSLKQTMEQFSSDKKNIYILVGPEGGISDEEAKAARECGWHTVTLGKRILRTETAPLTLLSAISYHLEDLQ